MKLLVVGGGNMGSAFARAFVAAGVFTTKDIVFVEPAKDRCEALASVDGFQTCYSMNDAPADPDVVVLAVKPQVAEEVLSDLAGHLTSTPLTISIMAGVRLGSLTTQLSHKRVVRSMPNTPSQIGKGVSVYISASGVSDEDAKLTERLLASTGLAHQVSEERLLDAATAVSGSGPGFVFYLIEHYLRAAESLGFSDTDCEQMVRQTFEGALELWKSGEESPAELREKVTSRGGTTEAGLNFFEQQKVGQNLCDGILAAYDKSIDLGIGAGEKEEGDE